MLNISGPPKTTKVSLEIPLIQGPRAFKSTNKTCGMLYEIQTEVQTIPILHLYCGAYEMGRAQGTDSLIYPINMRRRLTVNPNIFM